MLEDYPLSACRYCLFNVLATIFQDKILQIHYLIFLSVAHCDARNSVSFSMSSHPEYIHSWNCLFPQHGYISSKSRLIETLHFQNQRTKISPPATITQLFIYMFTNSKKHSTATNQEHTRKAALRQCDLADDTPPRVGKITEKDYWEQEIR